MKTTMKTLLVTSLAALSVLTPGSAQAAACSWTATDLPLPANTRFSAVTGASEDGGWVLGSGTVTSPLWQDVALLWHDGEVQTVPIGVASYPHDVNSSGIVVTASPEGKAFRGGVQLNALPGGRWADATGINDAGTAVGTSEGGVVTWQAGSVDPVLVPGTDNGAGWRAVGIDAQGRVAAYSWGPADDPMASYVWDVDGTRARLQPLRGHSEAVVEEIRNGRVVGISTTDGWTSRVGVEWDLKGNVVRVLDGSFDATDISSSGDVLGRTLDGDTAGAAGIWRHNGELDLPPAHIYAAIADSGELFGQSYRDGTYTPVRAKCA